MSNPRPSTDEETAPLLDHQRRNDSFFSALLHPARKLTNLEKILSVVGVILLLLASVFVGLYAGAESAIRNGRGGTSETITQTATTTATATTTLAPSPTGGPSGVCLSSECVMLSATILQNMNITADPCEDFYEYAVGGWVASSRLPADKPIWVSFIELDVKNKEVIYEMIQGIPKKLKSDASTDEKNRHWMRTTFDDCMDVDKLNQVGIAPLTELTDFVVDKFGPYDLIPAPEVDSLVGDDWRGTWTQDYRIPEELVASAELAEDLKNHRTHAPIASDDYTMPFDPENEDFDTPTIDSTRQDKMTKILAWLHSRGLDSLIGFNVQGDEGGEDPQVQALSVSQTSGGLPSKQYYEEKPIMDLYHSIVKGILIDITSHSDAAHNKRGFVEIAASGLLKHGDKGWPWPGDEKRPKEPDQRPPPKTNEPLADRMDRLAAKVVNFERELIRAGVDPEFISNPHYSYNPYNIKQFEKALPILDVPAYLSAFSIRQFPANLTVTYPPYLHSLTHIVDTTPDYILSAYFVTQLAMAHGKALGPKTGVWMELRRLEEALYGLQPGTKEDRQDVCLTWVNHVVGYIAGAEFVKKTFSPAARDDAMGIIQSVINAFHDRLPLVPWMDETSAKAAQIKAKDMIPRIGYPTAPNTTDPESLALYYSTQGIEPGHFFATALHTATKEVERAWRELGRLRDRGSWVMYPQTVNAYYSPPDGEITFPAGILQSPFYSHDRPSCMNYGAFGAVAAHELVHGFDNSGSQYDEKGRLRNWWTNETVQAFEERAQCIAKQYSQYYILDAKGNKVYVNGNLTNGEDIGDSGIAQSFAAWKKTKADAPVQAKLPGLDFTEEQLFFLSYARVWASIVKPEKAVSSIRTDPHSPDYWRLMGTLRNSKEFHEAFECKAGSRMNPPKEQQCELW